MLLELAVHNENISMPPAGYNISESATPAVKDEQNEVVPTNLEEDQDSKCDLSKQNQSVPVALGSICWLNMISNNDQQEKSDHNKNEFKGSDDSDMKARKDISDNMKQNFSRDSDNCCTRGIFKAKQLRIPCDRKFFTVKNLFKII